MSTIITLETNGLFTVEQVKTIFKNVGNTFSVLGVRRTSRKKIKELPHVFALFDSVPVCANDPVWHDRPMEGKKDSRRDLAAIRAFRLVSDSQPEPKN